MLTIISILVVLLILGFGLWLIEQMPMDGTVRKIIVGVAIFLVVLWLLQSLGLIGNLGLK